jgi:hypothetical protein
MLRTGDRPNIRTETDVLKIKAERRRKKMFLKRKAKKRVEAV